MQPGPELRRAIGQVADRHAVPGETQFQAYAYFALSAITADNLEYVRRQCADWGAITPPVAADLRAIVSRFKRIH